MSKITPKLYPLYTNCFSVFDLSDVGLDNDQIYEDVMKCSNKKMSEKGGSTRIEDVFLEKTPAIDKLYSTVDHVFSNVDSQFSKTTTALGRFGGWGHIVGPGEQTMMHSHKSSGNRFKNPFAVMSWCYWIKIPKDSGALVFHQQMYTGESFVEVVPKEKHLILFPGYVNHFTHRNTSNSNRVSMSGNYIISDSHQERPSKFLVQHLGPDIFSNKISSSTSNRRIDI